LVVGNVNLSSFLMEEGVFWAKDRRELAAACAATMAQVLNDFLDPQVWQRRLLRALTCFRRRLCDAIAQISKGLVGSNHNHPQPAETQCFF